MRAFASTLSLALALLGCAQKTDEFGFRILEAQANLNQAQISATLSQQLQLSEEAVTALQHGIELTLLIDLELRSTPEGTLLAAQKDSFRIQYLPLSQHFRLEQSGTSRAFTYPRLRHALSEISNPKVTLNSGKLEPGTYQMRARTRLDTSSLPTPMRLPAFFSADWQHASEWYSWPLNVSA